VWAIWRIDTHEPINRKFWKTFKKKSNLSGKILVKILQMTTIWENLFNVICHGLFAISNTIFYRPGIFLLHLPKEETERKLPLNKEMTYFSLIANW
jgi:hypothetical protein